MSPDDDALACEMPPLCESEGCVFRETAKRAFYSLLVLVRDIADWSRRMDVRMVVKAHYVDQLQEHFNSLLLCYVLSIIEHATGDGSHLHRLSTIPLEPCHQPTRSYPRQLINSV